MHFFPVPPDMKIFGFKLCVMLVLLPLAVEACQRIRPRGRTVAFGDRTGMWLLSGPRHGAPGEGDLKQTWVTECLQILLWFVLLCLRAGLLRRSVSLRM